MSYLCGSSTQIAVINQLYSGGYKEGGFKSGLSDSAKQPHRAWRRAGRAAGRPSPRRMAQSMRAPGAVPGWTRNSDGGRGGSLSSQFSGAMTTQLWGEVTSPPGGDQNNLTWCYFCPCPEPNVNLDSNIGAVQVLLN